MDDILLYKKIISLPENLKEQVSTFVDSLTKKNNEIPEKKGPQFGSGKGMFVMKPSFDEPLDDFKEYM